MTWFMRVVIAKMSVEYRGRGHTVLPPAVRALLIKADGAVSIHADFNGNSPINYMPKGNTLTESRRGRQIIWTFSNRKGESIIVRIHRLISDQDIPLDGAEPGLTRTGTEHELQAWIAAHPDVLGDGVQIVSREYRTSDAGAVDILAITANGTHLAVEVKRTAHIGAVRQALTYRESLTRDGALGAVVGMIAAVDIRPRTAALAAEHGIECVTVPSNWLDS